MTKENEREKLENEYCGARRGGDGGVLRELCAFSVVSVLMFFDFSGTQR
jgi:hypothetical protein